MPVKKKKEIKLSASRINTYLQCKQRYWFNYIDRVERLPNPVFALGLTCHDTLEKAGKLWQKDNLTEFTDEQIIKLMEYYDEASVNQGIQTQEDHILGREITKSRLINFKLGNKILGVEDRFGFPSTQELTTSDGVGLIGAIDVTIELDADTLLIMDYKTSKSIKTSSELRSDLQLSMYNLVANQLYPGYKRVILGLDMLRSGNRIYTYRTDEELSEFEHYLSVIHKEMSNITKKKAEPTLQFLCPWCDYTNVCEKYKEACTTKEFEYLAVENLTNEKLMSEWEGTRSTKKILEMREKELAAIMIEKLKIYEESVNDGTKEMTLRQMSRTTYDPTEIVKLIPAEDFANLVNISPTKLRKYLDKNTAVRAMIEESSTTNYSSAFLASRKMKKKN